MIDAKRYSLIALIVTLLALIAFGWGLQRLSAFGENDTAGGISVAAGGLTALFGTLALLNFRRALTLTRRMERGEGLIARWTVPAATVTAYVAQEGKRRWIDRSRWRPKPGRAAEVLFSDDAVLAGGRYHGLKANGLQVFTDLRLVPGAPDLLEFLIQEITSSSAHDYAAGKFELRIPVPPGAKVEADRVIAHFRAVRSDRPATSRFWQVRRKIGLGVVLLSMLAGAAGYLLAVQSGWQADDTAGLVAMVLMISGVMFGLMGLFLAALASARLRRER
jgi:uncharacterized membrane protein YidH (DUF202 family)